MENQHSILTAVRKKVENFFDQYPVPAHGFDHVARVADSAKKIAQEERARSTFLCELSGLLHDIGRVPELQGKSGGHHELSYELLRQWYTQDSIFDVLTQEEKKEILYAVRYHWNDQANEYDTAWILRDADKLDAFGHVGIKRVYEFKGNDEKKALQELRHQYQMMFNVRTDTAKKLIKKENLFGIVDEHMCQKLREAIRPIDL